MFYAAQITLALEHVHGLGIIYRLLSYLKTNNILLLIYFHLQGSEARKRLARPSW